MLDRIGRRRSAEARAPAPRAQILLTRDTHDEVLNESSLIITLLRAGVPPDPAPRVSARRRLRPRLASTPHLRRRRRRCGVDARRGRRRRRAETRGAGSGGTPARSNVIIRDDSFRTSSCVSRVKRICARGAGARASAERRRPIRSSIFRGSDELRVKTPLVERWTLSGCSPSLAARPRMRRAPSRCVVSVSSVSATGSRSRARRLEALSLALSEAHLLGLLRRLRRGRLGGLVGAVRLDETPHAGALHGVGGADGVPRSVERGLDGSEDGGHFDWGWERSGEAAARVRCDVSR